jgi:hypothetical protein
MPSVTPCRIDAVPSVAQMMSFCTKFASFALLDIFVLALTSQKAVENLRRAKGSSSHTEALLALRESLRFVVLSALFSRPDAQYPLQVVRESGPTNILGPSEGNLLSIRGYAIPSRYFVFPLEHEVCGADNDDIRRGRARSNVCQRVGSGRAGIFMVAAREPTS